MSRSNIAGVVSALVVIAVLMLLGIWLFTRAATQNTATTPADPVPDSPTEVGGEAVRTYDTPPEMMIDPEKDYTATITTPRGDIVIELLPEIAPQTVNNFVFLSREGFYDGLTWHRVIPGFMAQGGDPAGTGMGGPGYTIPAEFTSEILFDRPGIVAMARRGNDINSAGSQFFITNAVPQNPEVLNNQYTIFGEVVEGQDIVNNIPPRDPNTAIEPGEQIRSITIEESE
jgi:peptidylprolyl isomerase